MRNLYLICRLIPSVPWNLKSKNYTLCPHSTFTCFCRSWERTAISRFTALTNWILQPEMGSVDCAVRTEYLNTRLNLRFKQLNPHYESRNQQIGSKNYRGGGGGTLQIGNIFIAATIHLRYLWKINAETAEMVPVTVFRRPTAMLL
jgi:hypothetical protein